MLAPRLCKPFHGLKSRAQELLVLPEKLCTRIKKIDIDLSRNNALGSNTGSSLSCQSTRAPVCPASKRKIPCYVHSPSSCLPEHVLHRKQDLSGLQEVLDR